MMRCGMLLPSNAIFLMSKIGVNEKREPTIAHSAIRSLRIVITVE